MENYRLLLSDEIELLRQNGCSCDDWSAISVAPDFDPCRCRSVRFEGKNILGSAAGSICLCDGLPAEKCGIYDATLVDCRVGDNVMIKNVRSAIVGYNIGDGCYISDVGVLACRKGAMFGNGTRVNVLDETGGRSIAIFDTLSAQFAYLHVMYRHDATLQEALRRMAEAHAESRRADRATVGARCVITGVGRIIDVRIADDVTIQSVPSLVNGTIGGRCRVGDNCVAKNFIMASEASLDNSTVVENCFIGQCSHLSDGLTATQSLIFSNCSLSCGEVSSSFLGPHCTAHHKSILLIGGMFSFFNAGSGTNQSNHHYRLGPVHHGIMERGCKTASNTYVVWPARFGQCSVVMGSHYRHPDTSVFPHSFVRGVNGRTVVKPGANVPTVGLIRDLLKWPARDRRSTAFQRLDCINYDALSPVAITAMYHGLRDLDRTMADPTWTQALNFDVDMASIPKGRENYAFCVDYLMGETIVKHMSQTNFDSSVPLVQQVFPADDIDSDMADDDNDWIDVMGVLTPRAVFDNGIVRSICEGYLSTIEQVASAFRELHNRYNALKLRYVYHNFQRVYSIHPDDLLPEALVSIAERWSESCTALDSTRLADGMREYADSARVGFGIGGDDCRDADFMAVRGTPDDNPQMQCIHNHYAEGLRAAREAISRLTETYNLEIK